MSTWQIIQPQMSDAGSRQFLHLVTDFVKHPADLAIDALAQHDAHSRRTDLL